MNRLKIILRFALLITVPIFVCTYVFGPRIIRHYSESALRSAFPQSAVSVESARLQGSTVELKDVRVKNRFFDVRCEEVQIFFLWHKLLGGNVTKVWVNGASLSLRGSAASILSSLPSADSGKSRGGMRLQKLQISRLELDVQSSDLSLQGTLSLLIDFRSSKLLLLNLQASSAESGSLRIKNARLTLDDKDGGLMSIEETAFQKIAALDIRGPFRLEDDALAFGPIKASVLGGEAEGSFSLRLGGDTPYDMDFELRALDVPSLISELKYDEKLSMTGKFLGKIKLSGSRTGVHRFEGSLRGAGGDLVIRDQAFLENIAARMKQPVSLIEAGLKEYHYDAGEARLLKTEHDLTVEVFLDGPKGKRDLSTVFHDIF